MDSDNIDIEYLSPGDLGSLPSSSSSESVSDSKGKKPVIITKDEDYFIENTFTTFQVEQCLFRVPTYLFSKESHVFGGMFGLSQPSSDSHRNDPSANGETANSEGYSDSNVIVLPEEVKKKDFKSLLKVLYPLSFTLRLSLPKDEWISILNLSTKWHFLNLRTTAIAELENENKTFSLNQPGGSLSLTSLEKITLGREHRISSWLLSGLVDLVLREETINDEEALAIDSSYPTTAYRLFRTRERKIRGDFASSYFEGRSRVTREVEKLFKDEFDQVRSDEESYHRQAQPEAQIKMNFSTTLAPGSEPPPPPPFTFPAPAPTNIAPTNIFGRPSTNFNTFGSLNGQRLERPEPESKSPLEDATGVPERAMSIDSLDDHDPPGHSNSNSVYGDQAAPKGRGRGAKKRR